MLFAQAVPILTLPELEAMIAEYCEKLVVVDVRDPAEFEKR